MKKLGQHFLKDRNLLQKIVSMAEIKPDDIVVEIGAGYGSLTEILVKFAAKLYAFEIDRELFETLKRRLSRYLNLVLLNTDYLKYDISDIVNEEKIEKVKIVSNIPYYITTPIIENIVKNHRILQEVYFLVQKEYAERLCAQKSTRQYSSISIFVQSFFIVDVLYHIPGRLFIPKAKVDSSFIRLTPKIQKGKEYYRSEVFNFIRTVFKYRRKNIVNSILNTGIAGKEKERIKVSLQELGFDINLRPGNLDFNDYEKIYNFFTDKSSV